MSTKKANSSEKVSLKMNSKSIKAKTQEFLSFRKKLQPLNDILKEFETCIQSGAAITPFLLAVEKIFTELLKTREMVTTLKPSKIKDGYSEIQHREALQKHYETVWKHILNGMQNPDEAESTQALVTAVHLLSTEAKYPKNPESKSMLSLSKLRNITQQMLSSEKLNNHLFARFKEYGSYLDIVYNLWKILPDITIKEKSPSDIYVQNYLDLINAIPISAEVQENKQLLCCSEESFEFDYPVVRKNLNKVWACILQWTNDLSETTHKQLLVVLLEKILCHLDKPILLTDFLMDSLDVGGPVSLLALQGVFTLIQQHNLTYPKLYEKLYSMFEPEIFHTKYKARLFYLADIFLSSSHLPENLVAAFAKRLARLALVAPPQDVITIIYFIGNLILRHPGLKRMISHPIRDKIPSDPYIMDERDPVQSNAIESSLWEIASLQQDAIPSIAQAAKLISNPLPKCEWKLSNHLEVDENDLFDQEILKRSKEYALNFERPQSALVPNATDAFSKCWKLF
ncbi:nucleolar complex protein 4 homolog A isoform X1 [Sitodiplosis mosellana]|uniref:nucleolar complex protein 4 homolog A isoform X1 n=1 Tax=Sitodiplosis mosellana TaxID=263140 RepID=UPI002443E4C6|nr:nucleolar complex protein 4 homolog A isoform X1 [Sitodiplosis mosellana]